MAKPDPVGASRFLFSLDAEEIVVPLRTAKGPEGAGGLPIEQRRIVLRQNTKDWGASQLVWVPPIGYDQRPRAEYPRLRRDRAWALMSAEFEIWSYAVGGTYIGSPLQTCNFGVYLGGTEGGTGPYMDDGWSKLFQTVDGTDIAVPTDAQGIGYGAAVGTADVWEETYHYSWDLTHHFPRGWIYQPFTDGLTYNSYGRFSFLNASTQYRAELQAQIFLLGFHPEDFYNGLAYAFLHGYSPPAYARGPTGGQLLENAPRNTPTPVPWRGSGPGSAL